MSNTTKRLSERDGQQTLQLSFNDVDASLATTGFLTAKVGRKVTLTILTTNIVNDTEAYAFSESGIALYTYVLIYTSSSRTTLISAERIA